VIVRGIAGRIALAAVVSAAVGLVILAVGVAVVGADVFTALMMKAGDSAQHAREMYDDSVTAVVIAASLVAVLASVGLAVGLGRMLARPLAEIGGAARRIADGDYAARVPRGGPEEVASLADSFNQMAASLEQQEQLRQQPMAAGQVDHPPATEAAADPTGHFPGFIQLLAGQAAGPADRPGDAVEESLSGELGQEPFRQAVLGGAVHGSADPDDFELSAAGADPGLDQVPEAELPWATRALESERTLSSAP